MYIVLFKLVRNATNFHFYWFVKVLLGRIGKQGSQDQDVSQLMRDLYDSMERETDLKDQLKFAEEETKSMRKK